MQKRVKLILYLLIISAFVLMHNCSTKEDHKENKTPEALQKNISNDLRKLSFSERNNILESIYEEALDENPGLSAWENKVKNIKDVKTQKEDEIYEFENKNQQYYSAAQQINDRILDKELKEAIDTLILNSESHYKNGIGKVKSFYNILKDRDLTLTDYENALKIIYTLPYIKNYQNNEIPDSKDLKQIITEYDSLLKDGKDFIIRK